MLKTTKSHKKTLNLIISGEEDALARSIANIIKRAGYEAIFASHQQLLEDDQFYKPVETIVILHGIEQSMLQKVCSLRHEKAYYTSYILVTPEQNFQLAKIALNTGINFLLHTKELTSLTEILEKELVRLKAELEQDNLSKIKEKALEQRFQKEALTRSLLQKSQVNDSVNMVKRIRHNFSQSSGIEAVINLIDLIKETSPLQEDGTYHIDEGFMQPLLQAAYISRKTIDAFNTFLQIVAKEDSGEKVNIKSFFTLLQKIMQQVQPIAAQSKKKIVVAENLHIDSNLEIQMSEKMMSLVIKELVINSLKFSTEGDSIILIPYIGSGKYGFDIINKAKETKGGVIGIPEEYQDLVFEPFYRIAEDTDNAYIEHEITGGLGLGLTLVRLIIKRYGGEIEALNMTDHRFDESAARTKVLVELKMPL